MRTMAIEIAWGWVRFQPESTLTQWYQARCGQGRARLRPSGAAGVIRRPSLVQQGMGVEIIMEGPVQ